MSAPAPTPTINRGNYRFAPSANTLKYGYGDIYLEQGIIYAKHTQSRDHVLQTGGNVYLQSAFQNNSTTEAGANITLSTTGALQKYNAGSTIASVIVGAGSPATDVEIRTTTAGSTINLISGDNANSANTVITAYGEANINSKSATINTTSTGGTGDIQLISGADLTMKTLSAGLGTGNITIQTDSTFAANSGNILIQSTGTGAADRGLVKLFTANTNSGSANTGILLETGGSDIVLSVGAAAGNIKLGTSVNTTTTVSGDLVVNGTMTTVNSQTLTVTDNVIICNYAGASGHDVGLMAQRNQTENDLAGSSTNNDIVSGTNITSSGTAVTAGTTAAHIQLAAFESNIESFYSGCWIKVSANGNFYARYITTYVGATQTATFNTVLPSAPSGTITYQIWNEKVYSGLVLQDANNTWAILSTNTNPATSVITPFSYGDLHVRNLIVDGSVTGSITGFTNNPNVPLSETSSTLTPLTGMTGLASSGIIFVTGADAVGNTEGYASAVFVFSRASSTEIAQIQRLTSSTATSGTTFAEVDIVANVGGVPSLTHSTVSNVNRTAYYSVRFMQL